MTRTIPLTSRLVFFLLGVFLSTCSFAQSSDTATLPAGSIVLTGFAVDSPAQVVDIDDIAQGLSRAIARKLVADGRLRVRTSPDLLSFDWQQDAPPVNLLLQLGRTYNSRFIVSGELRNAGTKTETTLFGLSKKRTRAIELDIWVYDAQSGQLLVQHGFSRVVEGDVSIGSEHVFGGAAFVSTIYGKAITEVVEQVARLVDATVSTQH